MSCVQNHCCRRWSQELSGTLVAPTVPAFVCYEPRAGAKSRMSSLVALVNSHKQIWYYQCGEKWVCSLLHFVFKNYE